MLGIYFSGTGNSRYALQEFWQDGCKIMVPKLQAAYI